MQNVFVSSTFTDLIAHRESVRESLRQGGFRDIAMEDLGARDERPQDECLRLIRDDTDLFVGIYAHRYGFIADGSDISITEAEYQEANRKGCKKLIYIVDPETPWNPTLIDEGVGAEKLAQLKALLKQRHIVKEFTSPDNLAKNVLADLGREVRRSQLVSIETDQSAAHERTPWTGDRFNRYAERRFTELVHVREISSIPNQEYDILIYLFRHRPNNQGSPHGLSDITKAEFYLGKQWGHKVFTRVNQGNSSYLGIRVSAFGTFMCLCKVTFEDGYEIVLDRYIDFEGEL